MRNLKRVLSLTLASVMLLGMMVVGSSAAAGFPDVDENDNIEAIEVLQAVEVMVGDDRGFGPDRPVTRNEMAVVMGKLLNLDYNYYTSTCPFNDVANWARGWVGACYANGIVSGRGEGVYDGESTVTAVEAASMMMRALGYFRYQNDYADGFTVSTVRQGTKIGIFDMVGTDATTPMTRNQVAQMALNALQTGMVEPDGNTINLTTPDGSVFTGKVNYVNVTSWKDYAAAINDLQATSAGSTNTGYIVELGEQLYNGDLKLYDNRTDDFGRPSRKWEYDGKAIGTYMKKELIDKEWTVEVKGKDLYDLLGSDTIKNYDFEITIDGVNVDAKKTVMTDNAASYFDATYMTKTWKEGVGQTGKGVLTQVFVDPDYGKYGTVWISVINTYLAKATNDYNDKKDEINLDVYGLWANGDVYYKYHDANGFAAKHTGKDSKQLKAAGEDFAKVEDMKKDDIVLVTVADGEIKSVSDPDVLAAVELSEFSKNSYVVTDSKYEYNTTIDYDPEVLANYTGAGATQQLKDTEYNLFLDPYGYLIGVEVVEAVKNYIFLTGIDQGNSNLNAKTSDAAGILTDGTFLNFSMNMKDSKDAADAPFEGHALLNTWCTYTKDKNDVYTLKEVKDYDAVFTAKTDKAGQFADFASNDKKIDSKHVSLVGKGTYSALGDANDGKLLPDNYVYGNDDSVYILAEVKEVTAKNAVAATYPVAGDGKVDNTGNAVAATTGKVGIISGVESVGVGIDNVSIATYENVSTMKTDCEVTSNAYPGWIYTLFDDDGYVIAAIVLGEDSGTTKNLVYSHKGSVESEKYDKADDEWTWTRYVIKDGEEILLTQKGNDEDVANGIEDLDENVWYEITYKADGTVKKVEPVFFTEYGQKVGHSTLVNTNKSSDGGVMFAAIKGSSYAGDFVYDIENLEYAINDGKNDTTTLYEEVWGVHGQTIAGSETAIGGKGTRLAEDNAPSLKGSTLYVDTDASKGFYVHKDVKSVLIQKNGGSTTTTYGEGTSELESFLKDLNYKGDEATGTYLFKISAILTNGRATVVVIHDWNEGAKVPGTVNPKDDEEETGDIVVWVTYKAGGKQVGELQKVTLTTDSDGFAQLTSAKLTAPAGFELDNFSTKIFEKNGTLDVAVKAGTKTMKLPADYEATWAAGTGFEASGTAKKDTGDGIEVPVGAEVTVAVKGAGSNEFYILNPKAAADAADNVKYLTQNGTFKVNVAAADTDTTLDFSQLNATANKYYHVTATAASNGAAIDGITYTVPAIDKYMRVNDTVTVRVTGTGNGGGAGTNATVSITTASNSAAASITAGATLTAPANGQQYAGSDLTIKLGTAPTSNNATALTINVA